MCDKVCFVAVVCGLAVKVSFGEASFGASGYGSLGGSSSDMSRHGLAVTAGCVFVCYGAVMYGKTNKAKKG